MFQILIKDSFQNIVYSQEMAKGSSNTTTENKHYTQINLREILNITAFGNKLSAPQKSIL
jgi:hypothetical protein